MHLRTAIVLSIAVLSAVAAVAQVNTASLTGLVQDPSDAVIAGAKVSARNVSTGAQRSTETNGEGHYFLANLAVGEWEISVEKTGFEKAVSTVALDATQKGRQDFKLPVGAVSTIATVQASAPLLSPEDASLGAVVDNKYVTEYPLLLRSWDDLVNLVAGVQGQRYADQGGSTSAGAPGDSTSMGSGSSRTISCWMASITTRSRRTCRN